MIGILRFLGSSTLYSCLHVKYSHTHTHTHTLTRRATWPWYIGRIIFAKPFRLVATDGDGRRQQSERMLREIHCVFAYNSSTVCVGLNVRAHFSLKSIEITVTAAGGLYAHGSLLCVYTHVRTITAHRFSPVARQVPH